MTHEQLNKYILQYIVNVKMQSAIMLTGDWGSGKSYYIQNSLKPYLEKNKIECVVISLYGIKDLGEISKSIFVELLINNRKPSCLKRSSFIMASSTLIGKSLLKNVTSFKGIDISFSESDLKKWFSSINLKNKLVIFEDIERSHIDIIEFLGYVNNFVEHDNIKVLLVANEEEILKKGQYIKLVGENIKTHEFVDKINAGGKQEFSQPAKKYIIEKEKTISDTIKYHCNYIDAVAKIIELFKSEKLNTFLEQERLDKISELIFSKTGNLRSFIFACQKTVDIFDKIGAIDEDLSQCIFYSIILFSQDFNRNNNIVWDGNIELSSTLGNRHYPLFRPCFNYIVNHTITDVEIKKTKEYFSRFKLYNEDSLLNEDINVLFNYYIQTEDKVVQSIKNIGISLSENNIPLTYYGKLAKYLLYISNKIDINIDFHITFLISNLQGKDKSIDEYMLFSNDSLINNEMISEKYLEVKEAMKKSLHYTKANTWYGFDYSPNSIKDFLEFVVKNHDVFKNEGSFVFKLDIDKFLSMIKECTSQELDNLRGIFLSVYNYQNIYQFFSQDKDKLKKLINLLKNILDNQGYRDKIIKIQLEYFVSNLQDFVEKLENKD